MLAVVIGIAGPVGAVLYWLVSLYLLAVLGVIVFSWFPVQPGTRAFTIFRFLRQITDPVLLPLRRVIPPIGGRLDVSPIIVIVVLGILRGILAS